MIPRDDVTQTAAAVSERNASMDFSPEQERVGANVLAIARKYRPRTYVPELVELAITYQESGWSEGAVNETDPQGSYGPWQINAQAHPFDASVAANPWYDYGYPAVQDEHRVQWLDAYAIAWRDETARAGVLVQYAPSAQGSIRWSQEQAQAALLAAEAMLLRLS